MEELKKTPRTGMEAAGQQTGLSLAEAEKRIVQSAAGSMIEIGYYLKQIRDARLYEEKGYKNIWEYAEEEFGFHKSTASRYMTRNDRFSKGGNSPELDERYIGYSKSQLQEMLSLDDEQMGQVTPDMTVGEIRQIRKAEEDPDPQLPGQMEISEFLDDEPTEELEEDALPEEIPAGTVTLQVADMLEEDPEGVAMSQQEPEEVNTICQELRGIYLNEVAKKLIRNCKDWFLADFHNRVTNVVESEKQLKAKWVGQSRTYHFLDPVNDQKVAWINMFDSYVQVWDGNKECLGNAEWFYLCSAIQGMWNEVVLEEVKKQMEDEEKETKSGKCIHRTGFMCDLLEEDKKVAKDGEDCTHACCWNCKHHGACPYHIECYASAHRPVSDAEDNSDVAAGQEEILADPAEESKTEDWQQEEKTDLELVLQMHRGENELLSKFLKIPGIEPNDEHLRKQELKVRALEQMLEKMKAGEFEEEPVPSEPEQPELPVMKNDKERKEWLAAYQDWGIWYRDENIGATYYKYDFENGARLIVEEYENILSICGKEEKSISGYYHLVGGPEPARSNRVEKWTRHERYTKYPNSETELVEFLKEVQRK